MFIHKIIFCHNCKVILINHNRFIIEHCGKVMESDLPHFDSTRCGDTCYQNYHSKDVFFCEKGEICCPKGAYEERCSKKCGPYDPNGNLLVYYFFFILLGCMVHWKKNFPPRNYRNLRNLWTWVYIWLLHHGRRFL